MSANKQAGVFIVGIGSKQNSVRGNLIGTDQEGVQALGNARGVVLSEGASDNDIGGNAPFSSGLGQGNLISGNRLSGVQLESANANSLYGNFIGVGKDGVTAVGNGQDKTADGHGIFLRDAWANHIGGTESRGNVIAGNGKDGILIDGDSILNQVLNNAIGLSAPGPVFGGRVSLPNGGNGVTIRSASANTIGAENLGNVISANAGNGVAIENRDGFVAAFNVVQFNKIGTNSKGANDPAERFPNLNGVFIAKDAMLNSIQKNTIAFNREAGVRDENAPNTNTFSENLIFENDKLGIDVSAVNVTDVNIPVITSAVIDKNNMLTVKGKLTSANPNDAFTIEFFGSANADPTTWGEGEFFITSKGNVAGNGAEFSVTLPYDPRWIVITATATKPGSTTEPQPGAGTGEFSKSMKVNLAPRAQADAFDTPRGVALVVPARGVLHNDTDPDGDPLTATLQSGPANGSVTLNADGSFTYTPAADFVGIDSFAYVTEDGQGGADVATATIKVGLPIKEVAARFRSFRNTGGGEIYLGTGDLGVAANRVERQFTWQKSVSYSVAFDFDGSATLTSTVSGPNGTSLSKTIAPPGFMDSFEIILAERDAGSQVFLNNVRLNGQLVGAVFSNDGQSSAYRYAAADFGVDLNTGFHFTAEVTLTGPFSNSQEASKVEILVGRNLAPPPPSSFTVDPLWLPLATSQVASTQASAIEAHESPVDSGRLIEQPPAKRSPFSTAAMVAALGSASDADFDAMLQSLARLTRM